jgi:hypothetical protein
MKLEEKDLQVIEKKTEIGREFQLEENGKDKCVRIPTTVPVYFFSSF